MDACVVHEQRVIWEISADIESGWNLVIREAVVTDGGEVLVEF